MTEAVSFMASCIVDTMRPDVGVAAVELLRRTGADVDFPAGQTCCGQPAWNSGFAVEAATVARSTLAALESDPHAVVVVPAGSCATMIRLYWPQLFAEFGRSGEAERAKAVAARTRELSDYLVERNVPVGLGAALGTSEPAEPPESPSPGPIVYHRSCHMERELGVTDAPIELLERAGCHVRPWDDDDRCCGFGGMFSVKLPEVSVAMADQKLDSLPPGVDTIVGADSSCLLQLESRAAHRGTPVRVRHIAEVLADARP